MLIEFDNPDVEGGVEIVAVPAEVLEESAIDPLHRRPNAAVEHWLAAECAKRGLKEPRSSTPHHAVITKADGSTVAVAIPDEVVRKGEVERMLWAAAHAEQEHKVKGARALHVPPELAAGGPHLEHWVATTSKRERITNPVLVKAGAAPTSADQPQPRRSRRATGGDA